MRLLILIGLIVAIGDVAFAERSETGLNSPKTGSAGKEALDKPAGRKGASVDSEQAKLSPCECARNKKCWKLVMNIFGQNVQISKSEVDGALPGRFFPNTSTWALAHLDSDGHFLKVERRARRQALSEETLELEKRLIISDLLKSLALNPPGDTMFDPNTWAIDAKGYEIYGKIKQCRPGLLAELAAVAQSARPR